MYLIPFCLQHTLHTLFFRHYFVQHQLRRTMNTFIIVSALSSALITAHAQSIMLRTGVGKKLLRHPLHRRTQDSSCNLECATDFGTFLRVNKRLIFLVATTIHWFLPPHYFSSPLRLSSNLQQGKWQWHFWHLHRQCRTARGLANLTPTNELRRMHQSIEYSWHVRGGHTHRHYGNGCTRKSRATFAMDAGRVSRCWDVQSRYGWRWC